MPAEPTGQAIASVVFAEYVEAIEAAGGARDVVSGSSPRPRVAVDRDASVVSSNVLGCGTTGFRPSWALPPEVRGSDPRRELRGPPRHGRTPRTVAVHRAAGVAEARWPGRWRAEREWIGPATGGSAFRECRRGFARDLDRRHRARDATFARRWRASSTASRRPPRSCSWSGGCGRARCRRPARRARRAARSERQFLWLVIGIVALSISFGWIATATLRNPTG